MSESNLPVILLTGFLGSGKSTLLNAWLHSRELSNTAVIVNEFGDIGIDHALIAASNDNTIELSTGCLCCTVRGDLVNTLRELSSKRSRGEVRAFDSVVIETTGLADPAPVLYALMTYPVSTRYRLRQVITAVDAVHGESTLARYPEAMKQAAVADQVIITKTDLAADAAHSLAHHLASLNPGMRLHFSSLTKMTMPLDFKTVDIYDPATKGDEVAAWLSAEQYQHDITSAHSHAHDAHGHDGHARNVNRHSAGIVSFSFTFQEPLAWEHVAHWLDALVVAHGDDLLRVKGILQIAGRDRPVVVQAVQRLFHPPMTLDAWPRGERKSQIVFITRGLSRDFVFRVLDTIRMRPAAEI
ncbi:MAG: GTP-binding protein [Rhodospirillaceae bacterium]|nr:GTP-binding protein [Rhodospirillaceae bacterium]